MLAVVLLEKKRCLRTAVLAAALSVSTLGAVVALPVLASGSARMTASVLNVGQENRFSLFRVDRRRWWTAGSSNSWINAGSVAANQINTVGQTELTYLILTHYHADHANGIETLFVPRFR